MKEFSIIDKRATLRPILAAIDPILQKKPTKTQNKNKTESKVNSNFEFIYLLPSSTKSEKSVSNKQILINKQKCQFGHTWN